MVCSRGPVAKVAILAAGLAFQSAHAVGIKDETAGEAVCRLIEMSAAKRSLPPSFLTRLVWQESAFRADAISRKGAQGIAQFMPHTALERGLGNPFDPEEAIPAAASLLSDLKQKFGNVGLAAAAYNAGAGRVSAWIQSEGSLPSETRAYVAAITGFDVEAWRFPGAKPQDMRDDGSCLQLTAKLRMEQPYVSARSPTFASWGVQLAGNFSKALALAGFERARSAYADILKGLQPMIIGTRLNSRGTKPFYRIRVPAVSQAEAAALCRSLHKSGGACTVLRS